MSKVNVALVGLGRAGTFHMNCLAQCSDEVRLVWAIDINEDAINKAISRFSDCKGSTTLDAVLQDQLVDAVIIASTTHLHYDHICQVLNAGKAVFTEKPISFNSEEIKYVTKKVYELKLPFLVGFQRRFDTSFDGLKQQLSKASLGDPRIIRCTSRDNPEPPLAYLKISGGIFHDMLCHDFDMLYYLTGQLPSSVYSTAHCYNQKIAEMNDVDTAMCIFQYPSGLIASVDTSRVACYGYDQRVEVFCEHGMVQCGNHSENTVTCADSTGFRSSVLHNSFPQRYPQAYLSQCQYFLQMVREKRCPDLSYLEWLVKLESITSAAEQSWRSGTPIKINYD